VDLDLEEFPSYVANSASCLQTVYAYVAGEIRVQNKRSSLQ